MQEAMMPYDSRNELPDSIKDNLPEHAQDSYRAAFNSAWEQYADPEDRRGDESREETAHQVAWSAVKRQYEKDEDSGRWKKKDDVS
jgi:cation transport regulator